jgi:hypothetical protein
MTRRYRKTHQRSLPSSIGQDGSLSRCKGGFDSRRERQISCKQFILFLKGYNSDWLATRIGRVFFTRYLVTELPAFDVQEDRRFEHFNE